MGNDLFLLYLSLASSGLGSSIPFLAYFSVVTSKDKVGDLPLNQEHLGSVIQGKIKVRLPENIVGDGLTFITDIGFY